MANRTTVETEASKIVEDKKEDITIVIDGTEFKAKHRVFKSGREGYGLYGLVKIRKYPHRLSINIIEV